MVTQEIKNILSKMDDVEFKKFYRYLLEDLGVSRHASCELQTMMILLADESIYLKVLTKMGKEVKV